MPSEESVRDKEKSLELDVVYLSSNAQFVKRVVIPAGATFGDALDASGLIDNIPSTERERLGYGSFGRRVRLIEICRAGDRLEILEPLHLSPADARRALAARRKKAALGNP